MQKNIKENLKMSKPNYTCRTAFMVLHEKSLENLGIQADFSKPDDIIQALNDVADGECDIAGSLAESDKGVQHVHLSVTYPNSRKIGGIAKMWGNAHVEPQRGTKEQAEAYIKKTGKYQEKGEKILQVFGNFERACKNIQGHRTDLDIKDKLLEDRKTKDFNLYKWLAENINAEQTHLWNYCKNVHNALLMSEVPKVRNITVNYIQGESGSGKSYPVRAKMENVFKVNMQNNQFPFDGYSGEKIILFDELRPKQIKDPGELFDWLDKYRTPVNIKNGRSIINAETIYITSTFKFEDWYKDGEKIKNTESIEKIREQFRRRIDNVYTAKGYKWKCEGHPKKEHIAIKNNEMNPADSKYFKFMTVS